MAGVSKDTMDHGLEDGEISGSDSDSEMGAAVHDKPQITAASAFSGQSFQSRAPPQAVLSATSYRSTVRTGDSSDSGTDSDEDAAKWRRKRQKCANVHQPAPVRGQTPRFGAPVANTAVPGGRKVNNIWGSVVQEQTQKAVEAELDFLGVDGAISMASRQAETYNYVLARKLMEKEKEDQEPSEVAMLDTQLDEYMSHGGGAADENSGGHFKRKRPVKSRLGPRAEMDIKGRYEITEEDSDDRVIEEIAHRLQEPKRELIERVVNVIGKKKAIELLGETATLEETGGVYTMDGSRRRTPGGVYLNLLKNTPSITSAHLKEIFYDETQRDLKSKKSAQKRRRHVVAKKMKQAINTLNLQEHDDVSRETFASDTNEALESLEDVVEEEGQMQPDSEPDAEPDAEPAIGTEDTPVVYNAADLEVF